MQVKTNIKKPLNNISKSYDTYLKNSDNPVEKKLYNIIAQRYMKFLLDKVLEGVEVTLPAKMGTLSVIGRKQILKLDEKGEVKGLAPDWVGTKKLWEENEEARKNKKILYHLNNRTNGYRYRFFWGKSKILVENKNFYSLRLTRENKRRLSRNILNNVEYKTI